MREIIKSSTSIQYTISSLRFHALFHSLFRVLFNFPLRYLFAIGLPHVFSFGRRLPPIFGLHSQADLLSENISYAPALQ